MHILHILHMSIFCMLILHILHINIKSAEQNRALLDTLRIHQSNNNVEQQGPGHIILFATLLFRHTQHKGHMRIQAYTAQGSHGPGMGDQAVVAINNENPANDFFIHNMLKCIICIVQYAQYAQYASMIICRICRIICKIICIKYAK
jgi:hypothetical protein